MNALIELPAIPTREQIEALERHIKQLPQVEVRTRHYFAQGLYAREILIPAGMVLTGRVHKTEHLNIVSQGDITVWTEEGMKRVQAPFTLVSQPGTKRVGLAHADTVWTTIHACMETDLEQVEALLLEPDETSFYGVGNILKDDYICFLQEHSLTEEMVRHISEVAEDQIPFPQEYGVRVGPSSVQGMGLFAQTVFSENELIAPARIESRRTPAGRYVNHARCPNAHMIVHKRDVWLSAIRQIDREEEITVNYRQVLALNRTLT